MTVKKFFLLISLIFISLLVVTLVFGTSEDEVYADSLESYQKVIAPTGVFDLETPGVELWHDYGSFGLYKVSASALDGLNAELKGQFQVQDEMDKLLLGAYPFDTQSDVVDLPPHLEVSGYDGAGLYLVQFVGPIKAQWLSEVESAGAELVHYIANNGYLVWADEASLDRLGPLLQDGDFLQYAGVYLPYFKVGATLSERVTARNDSDEMVHIVVQIYDHPGKTATQDAIQDLSQGQVVDWHAILRYQNAEFNLRVGDIPTILNRPDVVWVGERLPRELNDEIQGQIMAANFNGGMDGPSGPGYLAWLDSYGFSTDPDAYPIVDITDDGIGNGTVNSGDYTLHLFGNIANPTRLAYVDNCTDESSGEGLDGHGHINVSIAGGYDATTGSPYQDSNGFNLGLGINPYGRFAGTRVFNDNAYFNVSKCGHTDTGLIKSIQDSGAQISSNSWGCGPLCYDEYDDSSQAFDAGVRDADLNESGNQELIFIFSAGNDGSSAETIGTPGNGKNMITVGASENDRPTWTDGCGISASGADDAMDVIYFSSRGPAPGGRVKPEVIAPGTHIQGTASTSASYTGYGVCDKYRPTGQTIFAASSGTSHSTPAVAGTASLYYYWLETQYGITPSPALMKAYLIAHPTYLTGLDANDTLPSNNQGYGMPDMTTAFDDVPRVMVNQSVVFDNSGETWTFSGAVADPSKPVRIVLAYTDKAGAIGTSPQVNNLNLQANIAGSAYHGNHFSGQWSTTGGSPDSANNYEAIFNPAGTTGSIEITVTGFNIADDGVPNSGDGTDQDFALVCYNCTEESGFTLDVSPTTQAICVPGDGVYDVNLGQVGGYSDPVTLNASGHPAGTTTDFSFNPVIPPGSSVLTIGNTAAAAAGSYLIDVIGVAPTSTLTATVGLEVYTAAPGIVSLQTPADGAQNQPLSPNFTWTAVSQAVSYTLEVASDPGFGTIIYSTTVEGTSHTIASTLNPESWYYWRVIGENVCGSGVVSETYDFKTLELQVLLVDDDDNAPDVRDFYGDVLDVLGISYTVWDTNNSDNEPDSGDLNPYSIVVWFTGNEFGGYAGPGAAGETALVSWLDSGGRCFFISSQDYEDDRGVTDFMQDYLGAASVSEPFFRKTAIVTGQGDVFGGYGPYTLSYPFTNYSDEVNPDGTASVAFVDDRDRDVGILKVTDVYKTTYWGFPFEAIPTPTDRQEAMSTFLGWCGIPHYVYLPLVIR
jgi:hypothetical protein